MTDEPDKKSAKRKPSLSEAVGTKATRKLRARRHATRTIWFGLGMMGLIGWSVAVPTLLGAALGLWLDKHSPGSYSWTLMLLVIGLIVGCWNAWYWVSKEEKAMREEQEEDGDE